MPVQSDGLRLLPRLPRWAMPGDLHVSFPRQSAAPLPYSPLAASSGTQFTLQVAARTGHRFLLLAHVLLTACAYIRRSG